MGWILAPVLFTCLVTYVCLQVSAPDIHSEIRIVSCGIWGCSGIGLLTIIVFAAKTKFRFPIKILFELVIFAAIIVLAFTAKSNMRQRALVLEQELRNLNRLHAKSTMSNSLYEKLKVDLEISASIKTPSKRGITKR